MAFDFSKTSIPKNNRIWVIWAIEKKHFTDAPENSFLRKVETYLKLP